MMAVIVPIFKKLFKTLGGQLPLPTRILITISNTLISWKAVIVVAVIIGAVIAFRRWINTEAGRKQVGRLQDEATRSSVIWSTRRCWPGSPPPCRRCWQSGVPAMESLDIVAQASRKRGDGRGGHGHQIGGPRGAVVRRAHARVTRSSPR